jgi:citrate lyase beta subunit
MNNQHLTLGASLYVPATRLDLNEIAQGRKLPNARSIIFCLEDSVAALDLEGALANLAGVLVELPQPATRQLFVRPRNAQVFARVLEMPGAARLRGFVIPKATAQSMPLYLAHLESKGAEFAQTMLMPTLETKEVFNDAEMSKLCELLVQPAIQPRILSLRIGGNDLLNVLGLRRSRHRTIYDSPIGLVIAQLVARFKPCGFNLTSPVCEHLYDYDVLERELVQDLEYGLFGKTAIHPDQVQLIEQAYRPSEQDLRMAQAILAPGAPAVFNMCATMCEVSTHSGWAQQIVARAGLYGVYGTLPESGASVLPQRAPQCSALA